MTKIFLVVYSVIATYHRHSLVSNILLGISKSLTVLVIVISLWQTFLILCFSVVILSSLKFVTVILQNFFLYILQTSLSSVSLSLGAVLKATVVPCSNFIVKSIGVVVISYLKDLTYFNYLDKFLACFR